jgi:hypothetical protein
MARTKDHRQEELAGMESPKDPKIERAARKWTVTKQEKDTAAKAHKSSTVKVRELMHAGEKVGAVRRVSEKGSDFLVYAREDINVRIEIKETLKVKMGEEAADALTNDAEAEGEDEAEDVQVSS